MRYSILSIFFFAAILFFLSNSTQAQEDSHIFTMTTIHLTFPEDGSMAEFDSLNQLYTDRVIKMNPKIISQRNFRHFWGSDNRQFVIMTEYKNMEDMLAANDMNDELFMKGWPTKEERAAYNKASSKYFGWHSDEIYHEVNSGRK